MKLKLTLGLTLLAACCLGVSYGQNNGDYRSVATGMWDTPATWEKYDSVNAVWNVPASKPGSGFNVTVRSGHIVTLSNTSNAKNLTIESGATLKSDGTQRSIRVNAATLTNNGTFGGATPDDAMNFEMLINGGTMTAGGTGTFKVNRVRAYPALVGSTMVINQDMILNNNGVGLTAYYNAATSASVPSTAAEDITITINAGKTVKLLDSTALHLSGSTTANTGGKYTYNINGTLDASGSYRTTHLIPSSVNASAQTNVNVSGLWKVGQNLNTVNSAPGVANGTISLTIAAGGVVDASLTKNLTMLTAAGTTNTFVVTPTSIFKRTAGVDSVLFPIATAAAGNNSVRVSLPGSAPDTISVKLRSSQDDNWAEPTKLVNRQWTINKKTAGTNATIQLMWLSADAGLAFNTTGAVVYHNNGATWTFSPATITGTGMATDPYIATITGISDFDKFVVGNASLQTPNGVKEVSLNGKAVVITPNPATGNVIRFQMNDVPSGSYTATVVNQFGQKVYEGSVESNGATSTSSIQLSNNTPAGMYQLHISNGQVGITKKVVVE